MTDFDNFISLNEAETLVAKTGQHRGTDVEFSNDGVTWTEAWTATEEHPHPEFARAIVTRKMPDGDLVPTRVTVRWDEYVPDEDSDRRESWDRMPTTLLGKVAKVSAYRGAFRDVIGERYEPAELDQAARATAEPSEPWEELIAKAKTRKQLTELHTRISAAKELTFELADIIRDRLSKVDAPKASK